MRQRYSLAGGIDMRQQEPKAESPVGPVPDPGPRQSPGMWG